MLYVETKESGSLGGVRRARPLNPPMHLPYADRKSITCNFTIEWDDLDLLYDLDLDNILDRQAIPG